MESLKDKLGWVFLLFPSFVSVALLSSILDYDELSEPYLLVYCFAFTLVCNLFALLVAGAVGRWWPFARTSRLGFFALSVFFAVVVAVVAAVASERDWLYRGLRAMPFTASIN